MSNIEEKELKQELMQKDKETLVELLLQKMFDCKVVEQELAKYKELQDRLGFENIDELEYFIMLDMLTDCEKRMQILDLNRELAELKENAIVPRFKYGDCVYVVYTNTDIFKGQIDLFDYYSHKYFVFFNEDIGSDWFFENRLFSTKKDAQNKLKEMQGNE